MNEYQHIILFTREYLYLCLSWITIIERNEHTDTLLKYKFIQPVYTGEKINIGNYKLAKPSNKYRITKDGKRYLKYTRKSFYNRYLIPITVSILTSLIVQSLLLLL